MILPSRPLGVVASTQTIMLKKVLAVASDVTPDAVNWEDAWHGDDCANTIAYSTPSQQITGVDTDIELKISWRSGPNYIGYKKSATSFSGVEHSLIWSDATIEDFGYTVVNRNGLITISNNEHIGFFPNCGPPYTSTTISVLNASDGDALLDTFLNRYDGDMCGPPGGCLLTTAVVNYMGLLDNGPELTAMRMLREHYRNTPGYTEIIQDYYINSRTIIDAINASADADFEYNYIYNTVIAVMNHVNAEEWQQGHDLYLAMYNDLKKRYLG